MDFGRMQPLGIEVDQRPRWFKAEQAFDAARYVSSTRANIQDRLRPLLLDYAGESGDDE